MNKQRNDFQAIRVHQQLTGMPGEIVSCPDHRCSSRAPRASGDSELDGLWKFLQVYGTPVPWEVQANAKHLPLCILDALFLSCLWMKGSQVHWYWCNIVRSEAFRTLRLIAKRWEKVKALPKVTGRWGIRAPLSWAPYQALSTQATYQQTVVFRNLHWLQEDINASFLSLGSKTAQLLKQRAPQ